MRKILNYINGEFEQIVQTDVISVVDPATNTIFSEIPNSHQSSLESAVNASSLAYPTWRNLPLEERSKWINKIADGIEEQFEEFAQAESLDTGKPISVTRTVDIPRAISNFRFFAAAALHFSSESHFTPGKGINYTLRQPIGVVGCISPWNLPLYLFSWKIAPALAAGNCVIGKPSDVTPYTAFLLSKVLEKISFPKGVLNILHGGVETGKLIVAHPKIKAISFTGSTRAGQDIASVAAPIFKKLSLELGGKNPIIIFEDCDIDEAVKTTVRSSFSNQGQICLCGSRIFIQKSIYKTFVGKFVEALKQLNVGDPNRPETQVGAIVSQLQYAKVLSYIKLSQEEGGEILAGGGPIKVNGRCENGLFIAPTVIAGLDYKCRTNTEEIFGPVVSIAPFENEEEVLMMANHVQYGLAASVWTNDIQRANNIAEQLECGIVWINSWMERDLRTPFGGIKNSGVGREGGWEAMRFFTEAKNIFIKTK